MPFSRPSPQTIRDRLAAEFEAALPGADARRRRSLEEILVRAVAIGSHELHGHLAWAARQILPDSSEDEILLRQASLYGYTLRAATAATGPVTFSGSIGATLLAGAELRRSDDTRYILAADVTIGSGGTASGTVTASVAGAAGNAAAATALTLIAPQPGIQAGAVVAAGGIGAGADVEQNAALRARLLNRIRQQPAGGAKGDYEIWALTVAGVDRVWVYPRYFGAGTVGVTFLGPNAAIPTTPLVASVQAAIDALRPVTADVTVFAPTGVAVPISLRISPDSSATRATVANALAAFFVAEVEPGATLRLSRLSAAISAAAGETWHQLSAPSADVVLSAGQIATLGAVTWV